MATSATVVHSILPYFTHLVLSLTVPAPDITFTASPVESPLYAGVDFTLYCGFELDSAIDTDVIVNTTWVRPAGELTNSAGGDRITVFGPTKPGELSYRTRLEFRPLSNANAEEDDGDYNCTATITPSLETSQYISEIDTTGTQPIDIQG